MSRGLTQTSRQRICDRLQQGGVSVPSAHLSSRRMLTLTECKAGKNDAWDAAPRQNVHLTIGFRASLLRLGSFPLDASLDSLNGEFDIPAPTPWFRNGAVGMAE